MPKYPPSTDHDGKIYSGANKGLGPKLQRQYIGGSIESTTVAYPDGSNFARKARSNSLAFLRARYVSGPVQKNQHAEILSHRNSIRIERNDKQRKTPSKEQKERSDGIHQTAVERTGACSTERHEADNRRIRRSPIEIDGPSSRTRNRTKIEQIKDTVKRSA